jgi:hypothetical protein
MFWFRSDNYLRYRNVFASLLVLLTLLVVDVQNINDEIQRFDASTDIKVIFF